MSFLQVYGLIILVGVIGGIIEVAINIRMNRHEKAAVNDVSFFVCCNCGYSEEKDMFEKGVNTDLSVDSIVFRCIHKNL
jgi:hypothetical protein